MVSRTYRVTMAAVLGLATAGCYEGREVPDAEDSSTDGGTEAEGSDSQGPGSGQTESGVGTSGDTDGGTEGGTDDPSGSNTSPSGSGPGDPPPECLPGAAGCECLDGTCQGLAICEDNVCVQGPPIPEVDGDSTAIAGLTIRLDGDIDDDESLAGFDQLEWSRVGGPNDIIEHEVGRDAIAHLPEGASPGDEIVFRLSANLGDIVTTADYTVTIVGADASGPMDEAVEAVAFGGTVVAPRGGDDYWIGTTAGMLARVDDNVLGTSYDLTSEIADIVRYQDNRLLVAQPLLGLVTEFNGNNNMASDFVTELTGGGVLGEVRVLAVDGDDNVYMGAADGTIIFYNSPDGGQTATTTVLETLTTTPTAFALSDVPVDPDDDNGDEGNILYIGTSDGNVVQIGLSEAEIPSDIPIGEVSSYLTVPGTGAVTGLTVDGVGNMWVGKSSGLYLVRRAFESNPEVVRTISPPGGLGGFAGLRPTDDDRLSWIDPGSGRVGRLYTGP